MGMNTGDPAAAPAAPDRPPATTRRATLTAVLADPAHATAGRLRALGGTADGLEVRADVVGDLDPAGLRRHFAGALTYALRPRARGGCFAGGTAERRARLLGAAARYDLVDLQWPDDIVPELLAGIPPRQRRISWHGPATAADGLRELLGRMLSAPAACYVVAPQGATAEDAVATVAFLAGLHRTDVTAYTTGPSCTWSRILAPWLAAPVVFGHLGDDGPDADGMPCVGRLVTDYGLPHLPRLSRLHGIVGGSPHRSAAPRLNNAAYRALGLPALFLPFPVDSLRRFWPVMTGPRLAAAGLPLRGVTVTSPHKEAALDLADEVRPVARRCGAVNILWRAEDGPWQADSTICVLRALARVGVDPGGRSVAVVGCGGAGRAAAAVLQQAGAAVTVVNRGRVRGCDASRLLGADYVPLHRFSPRGHAVLVHATPLTERIPFPMTHARPDAVVLEMPYRSSPTPLMAAARARGLRSVDGWDVLRMELREQFRLMTGQPMPVLPDGLFADPSEERHHNRPERKAL
ncbi:type I 3-dehydroquinate dehydratase [Streptomyces sp. NPDC053048]|uniref:type I 3-dehydroquinate dehydratase n=1 Tax=Streptomyces sp. NPDC053048 TaxID=3365694 RepID=UPI0037D1D73E